MAKTKKDATTNEVKTELEEQVVTEAVVAETPVEVVEETTAETPTKQENAFVRSLKSFGGKTKNFFVKLFKKDKAGQSSEQEQVEGEEAAAVNPSLMEAQLPMGVRIRRFLRSQSGWLFVLPAVILMCVFTFWPIISAFINAFKQDYSTLSHTFDGWGFRNFSKVLTGDTGTGGASFVQCLVNTVIFTFISVPLSTLLALLISVALNSIKPLQKAFQTIYFLPYLTNSLAMGAVFATFFAVIGTGKNTETVGLVNTVLQALGIFPSDKFIDWLGASSPSWTIIKGQLSIPWAKYIVVIIYEVWSGLPFKILILFSALQSVNKQYYDAAKIDGASKNTILWKITVPTIMPMISYLLITGIMGGMKQYTAIVGLFGESMGTNYDMGTMVGYIYQYKDNGQMGYAFAGSLLLFFIIMVFTAINRFVGRKKR